jgi:hypothetical protein
LHQKSLNRWSIEAIKKRGRLVTQLLVREEILMIRTTLGMIGLATALLMAAFVANASAQPKQTGQQLACTEIKDAVSCRGWSNCRWMEVSGKAKAGCVKAGKK